MNKKITLSLIILIVTILGISSFMIFGNSNDSTQEEDDVTNTEETVAEEEKEDENEEIIEEEDEDEERNAVDEYQDAVDEVIGDEELSEDEMIDTARSLLIRHYEMYLAHNEEEFEQAVVDSYHDFDGIIDDLKDCCLNLNTYENLSMDFEDESVKQISSNRYEYSATMTTTVNFIETGEENSVTENVNAIISKIDNEEKFLIESMNIDLID
ncbi:hypothetical protein [Alkalibacillus silvisoli]|uniref:Uncharacterized protein n=1 Tax=Alkalibacillus silvisoli TaxID=392823 RepID=A0ABN1A713_9BACI